MELSRKEGSRVDLWMGPLTAGAMRRTLSLARGPAVDTFPRDGLGKGLEKRLVVGSPLAHLEEGGDNGTFLN